MKKILLALLVLIIAVPTMGAVKITIKRAATDPNVEPSKVIISYQCTGTPVAEKVRAFALDVKVTKKAYIVDSAKRLGEPNYYYVTPTNIKFSVTSGPPGGKTYISGYGSPVVSLSQYPNDANGFTLEMASLYAPTDPNHSVAPPSSGDLISFAVDCNKASGGSGIDVAISVNAVRGGVVLEDGTSVVPVFTDPTASFCLGPAAPKCWLVPGQPSGDGDGSGRTDSLDYNALKKSWMKGWANPHGSGQGQYNCCCDYNHDKTVNSLDYNVLKKNWMRAGMDTSTKKNCP